ncbi:MAG: nickel-responsive transcriptional regulator NikR [Candidatus Goldiibacteriota bacterium]
MGKIIRFGVSLDSVLLKRFDALAEIKGYLNRSEAIRDLIRNKIVEEEWAKDSNAESIGTINIVYDHHIKNLSTVLNSIQHDFHDLIISDTHVHLDHDNCLDVIIVRGKTKKLREIADRLISVKGVKYGKLSIATKGKELK